jgi:spermidine synthase
LSDPRLYLALEDGRRFVLRRAGQAAAPYDLVLINLPPPSTLVLNRLYTREFLAQVRRLLAPGGVLAVPAPPARTYVSPAARDLLACYARTLGEVFPHVRAIPADEQTLWLASVENPLDLDAAELAQRWEAGGLEGRVLRADYLRYLLDATATTVAAQIAAGPAADANSDARPAGLRYALAYDSARLSPGLVPFFQALGQLRAWHVAVGIALLTTAALFVVRRRAHAAAVAVATTGLAGMTANVLILLSFQVLYGYVYQQVGLLTTAFMAGLSLGGTAMSAWAGRLGRPWRVLVLLEGANGVAAAGLAGVLTLLLGHADAGSSLAHALLLLANVVAGALVGLEFPLANHLLSAEGAEGSRAAGTLYAADLAGAVAGAVLVAAVCLPALGLGQTALLVALVKAGSLVQVVRRGWGGAGRG